MMRTRKEIRKAYPARKALGMIVLVVALVMYILGYLALEFKPLFVRDLIASNVTMLVIISIIWFGCSTLLLLGGYFVAISNKVRHHEYVGRPHTSSTEE